MRKETSASRGLWRLRVAAAVLSALALAGPLDAQFNKAKLIPFWDESDERNTQQVDHSPWQALLDTYLGEHESGINRVDYAALKASSTDLDNLRAYLRSLQALDPRTLSRAEQKAYWINLYNALTVEVVVDAYPVESIREIRSGRLLSLIFPGPWDAVVAEVAGQDLTLNNIENGILRPIWDDSRIHYAVNCASLGCPNLARQSYTASNTEELLEQGARAYINHFRGVDIVDEDFLVLSSIYDWFEEDFGDSEDAVREHIMLYAEPALVDLLQAFDGAIDYEYDWTLNAP